MNAKLNNENKQVVKTPQSVFHYLFNCEQIAGQNVELLLDVCSMEWDCSKHESALNFDWDCNDDNIWYYINPPFKQTTKWLEKALGDMKKFNSRFIFLIPNSTSAKYFHKMVFSNCSKYNVLNRIQFENYNVESPISLALLFFTKGKKDKRCLPVTISNDVNSNYNYNDRVLNIFMEKDHKK